MAPTGRRIRTANVSSQLIEQVGTHLEGLPDKPKEKLSLREAVNQLQDQIKAALAKGYSYDEVAVMLTNQGIEISPATLKRYVPAGRGRGGRRKTNAPVGRRPRKSQDAEESFEPAPVAAEEEEMPKTTRRRGGRTAAKAKTEPVAEVAPSKPGRKPRGTATPAAPKTTTRTSSTRRRKKA